MVESSFLDEDPVLFESASYWECRRRARELRARWYADILGRARRLRDDPLFDAMQAMLPARQKVGGPDLYFSRTFSAWIGALEGALLKVERGLDPICLDIYFDGEAFERDLAAEYPRQGLAKASAPFELLDGSVAVVPVHELARSPHLIAGVRPTFPNVDWAKTPFDRRAFELAVRHLDESLAALRKMSEGAYRSFTEERQTRAVALTRILGLGELENHIGDECDWNARLSGGEAARLGLVRALIADPDWLFLDEPTAHLDEEATEEYWDELRRQDRLSAVLISYRTYCLDSDFVEIDLCLEGGRKPNIISDLPPSQGVIRRNLKPLPERRHWDIERAAIVLLRMQFVDLMAWFAGGA